MKKTHVWTPLLALLAILAVALLPACTTSSGTASPDRSAAITSAVLELAGTSFAPVLANNPSYRPVAIAVAEALGTLESGTISAETIRVFTGALAERQQWEPAQRAYAELLTSAAWSIYTAQTGRAEASIADPQVRAWLSAFRRGLQSAVALSAPPTG